MNSGEISLFGSYEFLQQWEVYKFSGHVYPAVSWENYVCLLSFQNMVILFKIIIQNNINIIIYSEVY